ncbi:eyes absent homolog 3 isoform X1 [Pleurodeles waltl]|uniref:eyes absent homolog 3 isoform X1 n=1 Tax=Pleurodeles waltl TaxID=8319 RepID=UPI00370978F8
MEDLQDFSEEPVKKAKMQQLEEPVLSQSMDSDSSSQKPETSRLGPIHASEIMSCTDYIPRIPSDYNSQMFSSKQYTHILSLPVLDTMPTYSGQTPYQALQQSQPYTVYPQPSQTYGLPPFGALWPSVKSESGLIQTPPSQSSVLTSTAGLSISHSCPAHYSFPAQVGSTNTNTISTSSSVLNITAPTVSTASHQDYPSYTVLGQGQYQQCYPGSSYSVTAPTGTVTETNTVSTSEYQTAKVDIGMSPLRTSRLPSGDSALCLPQTDAAPSKELDELSKKAFPVKNRGKVKKADASSSQDSELERVFLWDLDETIIIFHSLLTGSYAQKYGKDPNVVVGSGLAMEEMIFEVADTHLFFNDLEECDQVHVEDVASDDNGQDLSNYNFSTDEFSGTGSTSSHGCTAGVPGGVDWMRKLAFRYRRVKEIYDCYKSNAAGLLSPQRRESLQRLRSDIETLTDAWLGTALKSLLLIQSRKNCVNVLVTTTQLVPALAKVLLYGLGEVFPIENIYSATKIGKESCFERVVTRFGKKVTYVVIGDGRDEEIAAKQHNMPFWRIANHGDLDSLYQALELDFL